MRTLRNPYGPFREVPPVSHLWRKWRLLLTYLIYDSYSLTLGVNACCLHLLVKPSVRGKLQQELKAQLRGGALTEQQQCCNSFPDPPEYPVLWATDLRRTAAFGETLRICADGSSSRAAVGKPRGSGPGSLPKTPPIKSIGYKASLLNLVGL